MDKIYKIWVWVSQGVDLLVAVLCVSAMLGALWAMQLKMLTPGQCIFVFALFSVLYLVYGLGVVRPRSREKSPPRERTVKYHYKPNEKRNP